MRQESSLLSQESASVESANAAPAIFISPKLVTRRFFAYTSATRLIRGVPTDPSSVSLPVRAASFRESHFTTTWPQYDMVEAWNGRTPSIKLARRGYELHPLQRQDRSAGRGHLQQ